MVQTADNPTVSPAAEQHFILHGLTWQQFKAIQASFEGVPNVRLFYCEGMLEIVTISKPHEALLKRCILFASPLEALKEFRKGISSND